MPERVERRVLGALRLTDRVSDTPIAGRFRVRSSGAELARNASGLYVVSGVPALAAHEDAFEAPPATPAAGSVRITGSVDDASGRYLPRRFTVALPRDPDPAHRDLPGSLFRAVDIAMYPSVTAGVAANWAAVYVHVEDAGEPVRGALARVVEAATDDALGSGITDERGEAVVLVPGIPITRFADGEDDGGGPPGLPGGGPPGGGPPGGGPPGGGPPGDGPPVVISDVAARVEVSIAADAGWPVDPDALESGHAANLRDTAAITLRTGAIASVAFDLS